jgi:hypothetical protein
VKDGGNGLDEVSTVTFKALKAGQSVTVAGLTVVAKTNVTASDVAAAFAARTEDPSEYPLASTSLFDFAGQLAGFSSGEASPQLPQTTQMAPSTLRASAASPS